MTRFSIQFTRQAQKDVGELSPKLKEKLQKLLTSVIAPNPFVGKKLVGDLEGSFSYRLTYQDRIVYSIDKQRRIVFIERAKTHYGE